RIGPIDRAPIDVSGFRVHGLPGNAAVVAETDRRAINEGSDETLALARRVEHEAARSLGAAFGLLVAESLEGLGLVIRAVEAAIADIDPNRAGRGIDGDAAQPAEAGFLALD